MLRNASWVCCVVMVVGGIAPGRADGGEPAPGVAVDLDAIRYQVQDVTSYSGQGAEPLRFAALANTGKVAVAVPTKIRVHVDEAVPLVPDNPFVPLRQPLPDDPHLIRERVVVWVNGAATTIPGGEVRYSWTQVCLSPDGTRMVADETRTLGSTQVQWRDGPSWRPVNGPRGRDFLVYGVNDAGTMIGFSDVPGNSEGREAFVIRGSKWQVLPSPVGRSVALAVSNSGLIVGQAVDRLGVSRACLWRGSTPTLLGTLGGRSSKALAVNDAGVVVGIFTTGQDEERAFVYRDGTMRPIELGQATWSVASGINSAGVVVGSCYGSQKYGFIAVGETGRDLNNLLAPGSGWRVTSAIAVNDWNQVLAFAERRGRYHLVLLSPQ